MAETNRRQISIDLQTAQEIEKQAAKEDRTITAMIRRAWDKYKEYLKTQKGREAA